MPDDHEVYIHSGGNLIPASDFATRHLGLQVGLTFPGDLHVDMFRVFRFEHVVKRQAYWWSINPLIRKVLKPFFRERTRRTVGRILSKRQKAWDNLARRLGVPPMRRKRLQDNRRRPHVPGEPVRCLGVATVSSVLLVGILATLAFKSAEKGGCSSAEAASMAQRLLHAACARASLRFITVRVTGTCGVGDHGFPASHGDQTRTLPLTGTSVDVRSLMSLALAPRFKRTQTKINVAMNEVTHGVAADSVPLLEFLRSLMTHDLPMANDVVRAIGFAIEEALETEVLALSDGPLPSDVPTQHARVLDGGKLTTHEMEHSNAVHLAGTLIRMAGAQQLSFATDGARIGFKSRLNTAWVLPDNFSTWGPPVGR